MNSARDSDRNAKRHDREDGHGPKDESAARRDRPPFIFSWQFLTGFVSVFALYGVAAIVLGVE